jgi:hypothetical protein
MRDRAVALLASLRLLGGRPARRDLLILISFLAMAAGALRPALQTLTSQISPQDPAAAGWGLWWTKEAVLHLENPWYTHAIFAPDGLRMGAIAFMPLVGFVLLPFTVVLGPAITVNLASVLLPPLAAYGMYRFILRLDLGVLPAWIVGAAYGLSPIVVWRSQFHLVLAVMLALFPWQMLWAYRYALRRRFDDAVALGLIVGAGALIEPSSALFGALLAVTIVYVVGFRGRLATTLRGAAPSLGVALAACLVAALPQLWETIKTTHEGLSDTPVSDLAYSWRTYGADLLSIFRPGPDPHLPGALSSAIDRSFSRGSGTFNTPGIAFIGLAAIGTFVVFRVQPLVRWLGGVALAAVVLSLGSRLSVGEYLTTLTSGWTPVPIDIGGQQMSALTPYTWLVHVPFLADIREAQRFMLLALPAATVAAAYGARWLLGHGRGSRALLAALCVVGLLEMGISTSDRGPMVPIELPAIYNPIKRDTSASRVVEVPFGWMTGFKPVGTTVYREDQFLRAAQDGHPLGNGLANRLSDSALEHVAAHPFYAGLYWFQYPQPAGWPTARPPVKPSLAEARADAAALDIRWAVVSPNTPPTAERYLRRTGFRLRLESGGARLFERR